MINRNNWKKVKLCEIAEIVMGQSPKSEFYNSEQNGLPFFQGCTDFGELYPKTRVWSTAFNKIAEREDVLMSVRAPVGDLNIAREKCVIGRGLCALRTKLDNDRFLYYLLKGNNKHITSFGSGAVYDAINRPSLENIILEVPDLPIQQKIASILSAYDDLIENNNRRIKILEEITQMIYDEWFVKFRFPGYSRVKMVDSELGKIPEGWEVKILSDIMDFQGGAQPPSNEFIDVYQDGYVRLIQIRDYESDSHITYVPDTNKLRKCNDMDIMIARYGASVARVCWGLEGAYNVALVKVLPKREGYIEFLRSHLKSNYFQKLLIGMSGRAAQAGFNKRDIQSVRLPFPKKDDLVNHYQDFVSPMRKLVLNCKYQIGRLQQCRDLLLPKLISGEIDVEDIDIDIGDVDDR